MKKRDVDRKKEEGGEKREWWIERKKRGKTIEMERLKKRLSWDDSWVQVLRRPSLWEEKTVKPYF